MTSGQSQSDESLNKNFENLSIMEKLKEKITSKICCSINGINISTPNDQVKAVWNKPNEINFQIYNSVRKFNKNKKSLVIASLNLKFSEIVNLFNSLALVVEPTMKQSQINAGGKLVFSKDEVYPFANFTEKKFLEVDFDQQFFNQTVNLIVNIFPAISDLKFIIKSNNECQNLLALLQHSLWANNLTHLTVICHGSSDLAIEQVYRLFDVINNLSGLQYLVISCHRNLPDIPYLPILGRLKMVVIDCNQINVKIFLLSLQLYGASNENLKVHLLGEFDRNCLFYIDHASRLRIVRLKKRFLKCNQDNLPLLCNMLPSLTSLDVNITSNDLGLLFTALSQLLCLTHVNIKLDYSKQSLENLWFRFALAPSISVKAIDLHLIINKHSQLKWLNMKNVFPNCQIINIQSFHCRRCGVYFDCHSPLVDIENVIAMPKKTFNCVFYSLKVFVSWINSERIFLNHQKPYITFKQLMQSFRDSQ